MLAEVLLEQVSPLRKDCPGIEVFSTCDETHVGRVNGDS
jgi:hypothetical protein